MPLTGGFYDLFKKQQGGEVVRVTFLLLLFSKPFLSTISTLTTCHVWGSMSWAPSHSTVIYQMAVRHQILFWTWGFCSGSEQSKSLLMEFTFQWDSKLTHKDHPRDKCSEEKQKYIWSLFFFFNWRLLYNTVVVFTIHWHDFGFECACSVAQSCPTPCIAARQAPLSVEFPRQAYWSGLP